MSFTLTAGWGDASVNGSARIVAQPSGQTTIVPIVNGELRFNNAQGVMLSVPGTTTYVMFFEGVSKGGIGGSIHPIGFQPLSDGTVNDLGGMSGGAHLNVVKKR